MLLKDRVSLYIQRIIAVVLTIVFVWLVGSVIDTDVHNDILNITPVESWNVFGWVKK